MIVGKLVPDTSRTYFVNSEYADEFAKLGFSDIDAAFGFTGGENLHKAGLTKHRERIKFQLPLSNRVAYLKRYLKMPILKQVGNWISHAKIKSTAEYDFAACAELDKAGIDTPKVLAYGVQWGFASEKKSFVITEEIQNACSLEKQLPEFTTRSAKQKFINSLADFAKQFHKTGYRHRDFYLCHIFYSDNGRFTLIDLQRAFKPRVFGNRYLIKDIAQLYYSSPAKNFTKADRLRFYFRYMGIKKLTPADKRIINKINNRAKKMAAHDIKHDRAAGYCI